MMENSEEPKQKIKIWPIVYKFPHELKEDPSNPNMMTEKDFEANRQSLIESGLISLPLIDQNDMIIDKTHTNRNIKELDPDVKIPCLQKPYEDDAERAIDRQQLNYGPRGKPEKEKQIAEFLKIYQNPGKTDIFLRTQAMPRDQFMLFINKHPVFEKPIPENIIAKTKPGDIFKLGSHKLMCGNATKPKDVDKLLDGKKPRLILTDPPYDFKIYDYLQKFFEELVNVEVLVLLDDKGSVELSNLYKKYFLNFFIIILSESGQPKFGNSVQTRHRLINHYRKGKSNFQNLRDNFLTIHEYAFRKDGLIRHEKPLDLPRKFIVHYTIPGEIVLDLFGGSGSTLIAAEQTGRSSLTMELDNLACDKIITRYELYTKQKAIKL